MLPRLPASADTAPLAHHGPFAKQGLGHGQAIIPRHILGAVDAFKVGFCIRHIGIVTPPESCVQDLF